NKNRINKKLDIIRLKANILRSLKNNFNLPLSLSFLLEFINKNENNIDNLNKNELITTLKNLDQFYQFLFPWQKIKKNILMMIKKREILRKNKKFELADKIREKLKKSFIYLEDQKERTLIVNLN
ncbi:MAG: hypothetical protein NZ866_02945, partial [Patescibacteria group bacterium]|nr:hypothetical protein [Patescibacteria group bacterium]